MKLKETLNRKQSFNGLVNERTNGKKEWEDAKFKTTPSRNEETAFANCYDGPSYANGNIHVGHANKISKDIIVRSAHVVFAYRTSQVGIPMVCQLSKSC